MAVAFLLVSVMALGFATSAEAANNPCTETLRNPGAKHYKSTWSFYHNTLSYIGGVANLGAAMDAGAGGWNSLRTDCASVDPGWRTAFAHIGNNTLTPDKADGYNTVGWVNFTNPPADEDTTCRNIKLSYPNLLALTCTFTNAVGIYEFGMSFNAAQSAWTSDLASTTQYIVQAVSTHEFGHAIGLGHVPSSGQFADGGALLTMYPSYFLGQTNNGWYTLGRGDMLGYAEVKP